MDHQLSFSKDQAGNYQLNGFQAKIYIETQSSVARQHYFELIGDIDANRAYQLLEGRSVLQGDRWIQLDFNDKDAQGNYRIKEFHASFGYDLEKVLRALPIKEIQEKATDYQLLDNLKQGSRQAVSFLREGREQRYYIEANPQFSKHL